jgi:NADH:ubiquinone oxidoreductase subunit 2 (subunit N)
MNAILQFVPILLPELVLFAAACVLFLLGAAGTSSSRKQAPLLALIALLAVVGIEIARLCQGSTFVDTWNTVRVGALSHYIKLLAGAIGILFVLLAWPTARETTGNSAMDLGYEVGEFFALMMLSICGLMLVASANDIILLFLAIELSSLPTYIMVSISRPLPAAQEAGVKYFFLGAIYMLHMVAKVIFGPLKTPDTHGHGHARQTLPTDLGGREMSILIPLAAVVVLLGVLPTPLLDTLLSPVKQTLAPVVAAEKASEAPAPVLAKAGPLMHSTMD